MSGKDGLEILRASLMEEYKMVRQECLDSMSHRSQIISFGLAAIGLVSGGTLAYLRSPIEPFQYRVAIGVFGFSIPLISFAIVGIWFGEVERMKRAGQYLTGLERAISCCSSIESPPSVLYWHQWLRTSSREMNYPYLAGVGIFSMCMVAFPLLGYSFARPAKFTWPLVQMTPTPLSKAAALGVGFGVLLMLVAWGVIGCRIAGLRLRYGDDPRFRELMNRIGQEKAGLFQALHEGSVSPIASVPIARGDGIQFQIIATTLARLLLLRLTRFR